MSTRDALSEQGIRLRNFASGGHKTLCPKCSHTRTKKTDPCLSVTIGDDGAVWKCHNCGWSGGTGGRDSAPVSLRKQPVRPAYVAPERVPSALVEWFKARGIPSRVIERNKIDLIIGRNEEIAFPYFRGGVVVNVKYRTFDKQFRQSKDAEKIYYGLDDIAGQTEVIICEGEIDKLSFEVAGLRNVVSVPDGAPKEAKVQVPNPEDDRKFEYVWNCKDAFENVTKIILATDDDAPGQALAEELARRYGKHRCWTVTWPNGNDSKAKDANEVLLAHGPEVLREIITLAKPYPIKSLYDAGMFETDTLRLYRGEKAETFSTGWPDIDALFRVRPGELSVVTGAPNGGKSQFVDALAINLANSHGWKFAVCSFENPPDHHIAKLAEAWLEMPFWPGPRPRMGEGDLRRAIEWLNERFFFIRADDESPTIAWILETARAAVMRYGIRGLVIDPYNEIEHKRPPGQTETEYVSDMLAQVKRFAQSHCVHVWFIAHPAKPQKMKNGEYPEISLYDISGSSHWVNKADIGIVVVRDYSDEEGHPPQYRTEIHVKKVRFKEVGHPGTTTLSFDRATGTYRCVEA